jgi:WD40 repeat protein
MANCLCFTRDGRLLTAGMGPEVKLWQPPDAGGTEWSEVGRFAGHANAVTSLRLTADESRLITTSTDATTRVWDFPAGEPLRTLTGHKKTVTATSLSPDEALLATASYDTRVHLYDSATGVLRATLKGHARNALSVCFAPDGRLLASAGLGEEVLLWSVPDGAPLRRLGGHNTVTGLLGWRPVGAAGSEHLLTYDYAGTVRAWAPATGALIATWELELPAIAATAYAPDGRTLAATAPHTLALFDAGTFERLETISLKVKGVYGVAWSHAVDTLACAAADGKIRFWQVDA